MEIEHKYLVRSDAFKEQATEILRLEQGYLSVAPTVRVRRQDDIAYLTIKGPTDPTGLMRDEWEYPIPAEQAEQMLRLCAGRTIIKDRYLVPYGEHIWEVDVFHDRHEGLVLAELEVSTADETYELPEWLGEEVTGDKRYYNSYLALSNDLPL